MKSGYVSPYDVAMLLIFLGCSGPALPEGITLGAPQTCENPLPGPSWTEVGAAMGLLGNPQPDYPHHHGGSAAVDDFDLDGDLDIILSYPVGPPVLYTRDGERFTATELPGPEVTFLLNLADVDGDGDSDLLAAGYKIEPVVVRNDGQSWTVLPLEGLPVSGVRVRELSPGDVNGDGIVDLYALANTGSDEADQRADFLMLGEGDGTFTLQPDAIPESLGAGRGFDAIWLDIDDDRDADLYVVNDDGADFGGNVLFRNDGGTLVDVSESHSAGLVHFGMGVDAGDFNRDGLPDLYLTALASNVLLQMFPDGGYVDVSHALSADPLDDWSDMGWGAVWLDVDSDGDLDILNAQGDRWSNDINIAYEAPIDLMIQDQGTFSEQGAALGLSQTGSHRSLVAADFNGDGVLDILATDVVAAPRLYLSDGCTEAGWLAVKGPVGSRVVVEAGGMSQTSWISQESSYGAGRPAVAWFGLGEQDAVDGVWVSTPDGREIAIEEPLPARRILTIEQGTL
ncbi:MAG: hypothetical protein ACI8RZ_000607 [Myxococcota bacterium]|jgi:hypothetical protein